MILSKSNYLTYLKHPAWLWLEKNDKSKLPEVDKDTQAVFDAGNLFEEYAKSIILINTILSAYSSNNAYR